MSFTPGVTPRALARTQEEARLLTLFRVFDESTRHALVALLEKQLEPLRPRWDVCLWIERYNQGPKRQFWQTIAGSYAKFTPDHDSNGESVMEWVKARLRAFVPEHVTEPFITEMTKYDHSSYVARYLRCARWRARVDGLPDSMIQEWASLDQCTGQSEDAR